MKHSFSKAAAVVLASMFALSACAPPSAGDSQPTTQAAAPETKAETGTSAQEDQGTAAEETNAGGVCHHNHGYDSTLGYLYSL